MIKKRSNIVEWTSIDEQHDDEKTPLMEQSMDNEKSIRYADINCNETAVKPSVVLRFDRFPPRSESELTQKSKFNETYPFHQEHYQKT
uniref:Uncharacterized protein LOC113797014 n=1 Tax=Dermatophagoides pteronyssinus TaxID=6956 RepID=A0A6P6YCE6_DERPT|nr:uncharacterized protein LOC113797014 [Dermatophagoides pteronyssinus]